MTAARHAPPGVCGKPTRKYLQGRTGTNAGYRAHVDAGEVPCGECSAARRAKAERDRRKRGVKPRRPPQCGTYGGYQAHLNQGEQACDKCLDAKRTYEQQYRRSKGIQPKTPPRCGTLSGYQTHKRRGEDACAECLEAHRCYWEQYRRRQGVQPFQAARCGTRSGYNAHLDRGGHPCAECRDACRLDARRRRASHIVYRKGGRVYRLTFPLLKFRYVGRTGRTIKARAAMHMADGSPVGHLIKAGHPVEYELMGESATRGGLVAVERRQIEALDPAVRINDVPRMRPDVRARLEAVLAGDGLALAA